MTRTIQLLIYIFVFGFLAGCAESPGEPPPGDDTNLDTGSPADEAPPWTAQEVEAFVREAFQFGFPSYPTLFDHHQTALLNSEEGCPNVSQMVQDEENWSTVWNASDCTTSSGWFFNGIANLEASYDTYTGVRFEQFISNFTITDSDGQSWTSGGLGEVTQYNEEHWSSEMGIAGTQHYENSGDWLQSVHSLVMNVDAYRDDAGLHVTLTGGLLMESFSVDFHDLQFEPACINTPSGIIGIRGPDGNWFDLVFDGDCSECAEVSWRGQDVGTACLESSTWVEDLAQSMGDPE